MFRLSARAVRRNPARRRGPRRPHAHNAAAKVSSRKRTFCKRPLQNDRRRDFSRNQNPKPNSNRYAHCDRATSDTLFGRPPERSETCRARFGSSATPVAERSYYDGKRVAALHSAGRDCSRSNRAAAECRTGKGRARDYPAGLAPAIRRKARPQGPESGKPRQGWALPVRHTVALSVEHHRRGVLPRGGESACSCPG